MSQTAYWPWPPDCLTCRPCPLAGPANVSRSDTRSGTESTCDAVPVAQPVEQHVDVRLAHAPQHQLVGLRVVLQPQRRVLGDEPAQALGELVLVGLARAPRSRPAAAGRASTHGSISSGSSLSDRVSPVSARVSLAIAHDVAGDGLGDGALGLAERGGQRADPLVDVVVLVAAVVAEERREVAGDVHRRVRAQRAGEDPDQADPADVRVGGGLDDLGDAAGRPGRTVSGARGLAGRGGDRRAAGARAGTGSRDGDHLEQLGACRARSARQTASTG